MSQNSAGNSFVTVDSGSDIIAPVFAWRRGDQGLDVKIWDTTPLGANLQLRTVNDTYSGATTWLQVNRGAGTTINSVGFPTGNVGIGTLIPASKLDVAGDINFNGLFGIKGTPCYKCAVPQPHGFKATDRHWHFSMEPFSWLVLNAELRSFSEKMSL
jgi:hypothetical protein